MPANLETAQPPMPPPRDKQLSGVALAAVLRKRQLGQALNAKEFAVLAGICYSTARSWFRLPGFPVIRGFVFWEDFARWRQARFANHADAQPEEGCPLGQKSAQERITTLSPRASRILAEAG